MSSSTQSLSPIDAWLASSIGQWAQQYINLGFAVFPCHGFVNNKCTCGDDNCANQGKHPSTKHGLKDASKDIAVVASMFKYRGDYNIAIATGLISEIFVVDIDNNAEISGDDTLRSLAADGKTLPQTLTSLTGNGRHLFFNYPDFEVGNRAKIMHQIDIRGTGGYIIAPPSHHKSGRDYEFDTSNGNDIVDAPEWLLEMLKPKPKEVHVKIYDTHHDKPELNEAISALQYIPAENYQTWVDMGMCLRDCFGSAGFNAWDAWSSTSSKYNANEMRKKWGSFKNTGLTIATLFDQARLAGWRPAPTHHEVIDTSMVDSFVSHIKKPLLEVRIDFDPMDMPGLIGDTVRWIVKSALQPQPMLAFLNVIAFAGSVFGRRYASPYDTRTNVYMVGVGETGCHAKGTKILMYDGSIKSVEDVNVGDILMGADSTPREVFELIRGYEKMYKITPIKGEPFIVNKSHILSLYCTTMNSVYKNATRPKINNISVTEYAKQHKTFKHLHKLYYSRECIFPQREKPLLNAWFLGALIGDGCFVQSQTMASADEEISQACIKYAKSLDIPTRIKKYPHKKSWDLYFCHPNGHTQNLIRDGLKHYNLWGKKACGKFIPEDYKRGSIETRLEILAGLIDTDGHLTHSGYEITCKAKRLAEDIQFIARSLGLSANLHVTRKKSQTSPMRDYWRVNINGDCSKIPVKCLRKKASKRLQKKNHLVTGFSIEEMPDDNFYGFRIDKDHLYLTGDFMVHHNCGKDYSRKMVGKLAEAAGLSQFLGGHSIRSDTGMVRGLSVNCSQLLMLDEFGKLLQALTDKGSSSYHKSIVKVLMSLYSDSSGVYNHGDYANPKINQTIVINRPNLCIYGTTTESEYIKGLHRDAVLSGELNRVIAIKVESVDPRRLNAIPKMDNDLLLEWKRHAPSATNAISLNAQPPEPTIVEWGDCDDLQWSIRQEQERIGSADLQTKALWHRRHENIIKVAMILAIARDKSFPRFETEDFNIAKQVVDASIKYMSNLVGENMSESVYEEQQQEIKAFIKKYPKGVDRTMLSNRFRKIEKRKREEIMADMITLGLLRVEASEGKRQTYFVI